MCKIFHVRNTGTGWSTEDNNKFWKAAPFQPEDLNPHGLGCTWIFQMKSGELTLKGGFVDEYTNAKFGADALESVANHLGVRLG